MKPHPTLFPTIAAHVLWHRASGRHKWRVVGSHDYAPKALALMAESGLHGGEWMLIEGDRDPNDKLAYAGVKGAVVAEAVRGLGLPPHLTGTRSGDQVADGDSSAHDP